MVTKRSKPAIVQGRTYRLTERQAEVLELVDKPGTAPCGQVVADVVGHQNSCRTCLTTAGAHLPADVREEIADKMWRATSAERLAAFTAWRRKEAERLLAELDRLDREGPRRTERTFPASRACPACGQVVGYSVQRGQRFFEAHPDPATGQPCQWWAADARKA